MGCRDVFVLRGMRLGQSLRWSGTSLPQVGDRFLLEADRVLREDFSALDVTLFDGLFTLSFLACDFGLGLFRHAAQLFGGILHVEDCF